jgi:hypothetical protein
MNTIKTIQDFKNFVGDEGKLFSIKFLKDDYSERTMVARFGVRKYRSGTGMKYDPEARGNLVVFSMQDDGYRTFKFDRLLKVKAHGQTIIL